MADRDFAQLQTTARPPVAGLSGLRTALLVIAILAVVISGFVGGYWLGSRQGHETAETEAKAELVAQIQEQKQELAVLRRQQAEDQAKAKADAGVLPNADVGDLTFYTDLPKQPVKPEPLSQPVSKPGMSPPAPAPATPPAHAPAQPAAPSAAPVAAAAPTPAPGSAMVHAVIQRSLGGAEGYYVQVASFRDAQSASRVKARLAGIGLDSALRRVQIPGRGTWYRLQVGPYGSQHDAEAVRIDIEQKIRMKGLVVHEGG